MTKLGVAAILYRAALSGLNMAFSFLAARQPNSVSIITHYPRPVCLYLLFSAVRLISFRINRRTLALASSLAPSLTVARTMYLVPPISYSRTMTGGELVGLVFMVLPPFLRYLHIPFMLFARCLCKYKPLCCNGYGLIYILADDLRSYNTG